MCEHMKALAGHSMKKKIQVLREKVRFLVDFLQVRRLVNSMTLLVTYLLSMFP